MTTRYMRKKKHAKASEPSLRKEWASWYEEKGPVLHFGLKFGVLVTLFYGLMALPFCDRMLLAYLEAYAWLSNAILDAWGEGSHVSGVSIESPRFAMAIRRGCDAIEPTWLFCAAVLAYPSPLKRKVVGIFAVTVVLQLLNLVRILSLYWIGVHAPAFFNSVHMEIWPTIFIIVVILLFVGWRASNPEKSKSHAA